MMTKRVKNGFWTVLVPGALAHLRYKNDPEPTSPTRIYALLEELGFLDGVEREPDSILATIRNRMGSRYKGLIPD